MRRVYCSHADPGAGPGENTEGRELLLHDGAPLLSQRESVSFEVMASSEKTLESLVLQLTTAATDAGVAFRRVTQGALVKEQPLD